jgi:sulfatase maturation enzyme AslB (radical SAM superfamily)
MSDNKFICDFPWIHLSTFPQGNCTVCCVADHAGKNNGHSWNKKLLGGKETLTVERNTISEIVNCDNYRTIRLDMLHGKIPPACNGCHAVEEAGGQSRRQKETIRNLDFESLTSKDGSIAPDLRHIELRLGNYCNLKCRTCNADSSTSWIADYYKLKDTVKLASGYHEIKSNPVFSFDWVDDENFYNKLLEASPNLEQIHISGGEPFLVPKHFYWLERLVAEGRTNIAIHYHTNLNYNFEKIKPALDLLTKFKEVRISFSIDDVQERNTYIRSLSDWDLTIKNLRLFLENYKFIYRVTQTVNVYNFLYVEELEQFLNNSGIPVIVQLNHVHSPDYLMSNALPKEVRQQKIDSIKGVISDRNYYELYGHYYNTESNGQWEYFKYFTNEVDKIRNEELKIHFDKLIKLC